MPYLSLYRKYRPQTFAEILGQEHVSTTLANAIDEDRVAHAYLFAGPRGTGKTSTARILAKALNCERGPSPSPCGECGSCRAITEGSSLDVIEIDAASHSKVDETREILAGVPLATAGARKKVYVIDEVHMLSVSAFNALLKTLEEPPGHVVFVLATTEPHKVLATIVSRTQRFDFRRAPAELLQKHLSEIAKLENVDVDPDALTVVARHANGSFRDALSALEQLATLGGHVSLEDAESLLGRRWEDAFVRLFDAIVAADVGAVFTTVDSLVSEGADLRQLAIGVLGHARSLLLLKTVPNAEALLEGADDRTPVLTKQSEALSTAALMRVLDLVGKAWAEMRDAPNHRLLLELALVRATAPETDPSANGLLGRIERLERRVGIEPTAPPQPPASATSRRQAGVVAPKAEAGPPTSDAPTSRDRQAVEPAPSPAREPTSTTTTDHVGLSHISDAWSATLKEVNKRSKRVGALLNPSSPVRFDGDRLVVRLQHDFHRDAMTHGPTEREILAEALHAALGIRPALEFVGPDESAPSAELEPAEVTYAEATDAAPAEEDPIELVKRGLSAEVVEERGRS